MEKPMKKLLLMFHSALLVACLGMVHIAWADNTQDSYYESNEQASESLFSPEELEDLVAPIALYPDPLIAQILPASTFIDQIDEAARYVKEYGKYARIDSQYWDVSVKAVAHYPDVLSMMDRKYDWTVALGQAFINQRDDLMYAIQLLRQDAREAGNLVSNRQQQVLVEDGYISIIPAEPQTIYVPVYDPQVVYVERPSPAFGFITFGIGFSIGAWLNRDFDWPGHRIYYHGWRGRQWVDRARPHVRMRNNIYINNTNTVITVNKRVMQHDTERFRRQIRQDVQIRRVRQAQPGAIRRDQRIQEKSKNLGGRPVPTPVGPTRPGGAPRHDQRAPDKSPLPGGKPTPLIIEQPRTAVPAPDRRVPVKSDNRGEKQGQPHSVKPIPTPPSGDQQPRPRIENRGEKPGVSTPAPQIPTQPANRDVYRGRDTQSRQPASRSGYGGYGTARDASSYRERGKTSQENMQQKVRPMPAQQQPPAPQQVIPQKSTPAPQPMQRTAPSQRPVKERKPESSGGKEERPQKIEQPAPRRAPDAERGEKEKEPRRQRQR
jgi:hypothetical protein